MFNQPVKTPFHGTFKFAALVFYSTLACYAGLRETAEQDLSLIGSERDAENFRLVHKSDERIRVEFDAHECRFGLL